MKHSLKNTFPRYGKTASSSKKNRENGFHWKEFFFFLNRYPLILTMVSNIWKRGLNKSIRLPLACENKFPLTGMEDLFKNMFSLYGIWKNWMEWFLLAKNLIYISWNKVLFLTTFFSIKREICSCSSNKVFH